MPVAPTTLDQSVARVRAQTVERVAYFIELDLTPGSERFGFDAALEFSATTPGAATFVDADLAAVTEILWNGSRLPDSAYDGHRIALNGLAAHNSLRVRGQGSYDLTGLGLHRSLDPVDGSSYIYSDFEPFEAHRSFPCFDQPDIKGSFRLRIRAPQDWLVVSAEPGQPEEVDPEDGCRWWGFPSTMPLAPYVLGIAAGPFHLVEDLTGRTPLGLYCAKSLAPYLDADELFAITSRGLDYFERLFGIPYPFAKYDQVFCPEKLNGAMESPGCVTITDQVLYRGRATTRQRSVRADRILHEMAHMWFGDLVTMRWWDDIWLNESFATLMSVFAVDRATRFTDAWVSFATVNKQLASDQDQLKTSHPVVTEVPDVESVRANFDPITYEKGAAVLRQLVAYVGEDNFFTAIRSHLMEHREGNAEFSDLVEALQATSSHDVRAWAQAWLVTPGINLLRCEVHSQGPEAASEIVAATLIQSATPTHPTLRPHRVRLGRFDWVGDKLARVGALELDAAGARTDIDELRGISRPALLLPNDGDLTYAKIRLDSVSLATAEQHLSSIPEDLARALIWDLTWDMVRDLELPAHRFTEMVAAHIASERDSTLVSTVLASARTAARRYAAPRRRAALEERLGQVAWEALASSPPESDEQAVWLRAFIGLATSSKQVQLCRRFLKGRGLPSGVALDPELHWLLVHSLAARGAAEESEIATALAADPSSTGMVRAQAARAARPTAKAKAAAWARLRAPEVTAEEARMIGYSMGGVGHEELIAPYVPQLPQLFDQVLSQMGAEFTVNLGNWLPYAIPPSQELTHCCRDNLARDDLDPVVARIFGDLLEETERYLRARLLDEGDEPDSE